MLRTNVGSLHELAAPAPSFQPSWDEDDSLSYVEVGDLVRHLRAKMAKGEINQVPAVFDLTERLLANNEVDLSGLEGDRAREQANVVNSSHP
jgi:hypothetical protein